MSVLLSYPQAPLSLVLSWENPIDLQQTPVIDRRNGGTERRGGNFQLNRVREGRDVNTRVVSIASYLEIEAFLGDRRGRAFVLDGKLWQVFSWSWNYLGGVGPNAVSELTMNMKQVFR